MAKAKVDWVALARDDAQPQVPEPMVISVSPGRLAAQVSVDVPETGERFELEATTIRDFNDAFLAAVGFPRS